jgi:2-alkyl-3-oxoalkanoate reductase
MGTESRGASNAKAKRELGWAPRHRSWREGFAAVYGGGAPARERQAGVKVA